MQKLLNLQIILRTNKWTEILNTCIFMFRKVIRMVLGQKLAIEAPRAHDAQQCYKRGTVVLDSPNRD